MSTKKFCVIRKTHVKVFSLVLVVRRGRGSIGKVCASVCVWKINKKFAHRDQRQQQTNNKNTDRRRRY